jgi:CubicO group peptidase (beta-lactamase class C family)
VDHPPSAETEDDEMRGHWTPALTLVTAVGIATAVHAGERAGTTADYRKAAAFSEANNGTAMLVMVDGDVVFERYSTPAMAETPHFLASATKSFWGPVVAAMISDGLISGYDELAADTLTEWRGDPRKSTITLRQILSLSSGLHNDVAAIQGEGTADNLYSTAVGASLDNDPGTKFTYGPVNFYVLGEIIKRKLAPRRLDPLQYLERRIFEPIGLEHGRWIRDRAGNPHIPNGAYLTAREWAKFGQLVLQLGEWQGEQIIPRGLVTELIAPSAINPGYGLTFWLNRPGGVASRARRRAPEGSIGGFIYSDAAPDLAAALGAGPNCLYIIPSRSMVVVRQVPAEMRPANRSWADHGRIIRETAADYSDAAFLGLLLGGDE